MIEILKERRQYKRINTILDAVFIPCSDLVTDWRCMSKDLSEGGIKLVSIREPILSQDIEVSLHIPSYEDKLTISSQVMWTHPHPERRGMFEIGLKFLDMNDEKKAALKEYIEENIPQTA